MENSAPCRLLQNVSFVLFEEHSRRPLKMFTNFMFFANHLFYKIYGMVIFIKLADNGLSGCSGVVGVNSRKRGRFGVLRAGALGLTSWWDRSKKFRQGRKVIGGFFSSYEAQTALLLHKRVLHLRGNYGNYSLRTYF